MTGPQDGGGASPTPQARLSSDLGPRAASSVVMIAAALGTLWLGGDVFILFWLGCALALHWEWQGIIDAPRFKARFFCGAFFLLLAVLLLRGGSLDWAFVSVWLGAAALAWLAGPGKRIWAGAGMGYAASVVISVTLLRVLSRIDGVEAILWLFAVVWGTDVMAYFGGRLIGGPKLWPRLSPSKTWAGFLVGVFSGGLLGLLCLVLWPGAELASLGPLFVLGVLAGVIAQAGDFFESGVKRRFDVKDSSHLIPGHGGFMDRLDGFIAAAAFAALVGWIKSAGPGFIAIGLLRW
jgi:phosphatidate cytidylyltransferase